MFFMAVEILCDAVTCAHNGGNLGGTYPRQGLFPCLASQVIWRCGTVLCPECENEVELTDCENYTQFCGRQMREWLKAAMDGEANEGGMG